jgi:hypothetical protein
MTKAMKMLCCAQRLMLTALLTVHRLAAASVMVGEFDGARFMSMVLLEGALAKRTLSGHKSRYGVGT